MQNNLKFVFFGTPDVASETLEILKQNGYLPSLIVTSPDAKKGRGLELQASPAALFAEANNIPCLKTIKLDEEFTLLLSTFNFQLNVVVAYGKIMPENVINLPRLGSINIHYSLLPKYRGASPVESAILNGDTVTGVTIQQMEYKLDAGDIMVVEETEIFPTETAPELRARLIKKGGELLVKNLPEIISGTLQKIKQNEAKATHSKKIKKEDGLIDLNDDGVENYNKFRAYATWPRTFFFKDNKRIIITQAHLENGNFIIDKIIPEGGKEMDYKS